MGGGEATGCRIKPSLTFVTLKSFPTSICFHAAEVQCQEFLKKGQR